MKKITKNTQQLDYKKENITDKGNGVKWYFIVLFSKKTVK
jgi:hypothetical protein